jgi:predicted phage terminase large subunit-like protein
MYNPNLIEAKKESARLDAIANYRKIILQAQEDGQVDLVMRELCKKDLFFLGIYVLGGKEFANNDWVFERCREFENSRDGFLDLWPREHYKSTIITLWAAIQEIIRDPEITIGIFSFNRPAAKVFLRAIKQQLENNSRLKELFPDIFYANPDREAPKWSEDDGIVVKRKGMPKEMTVEAWGLVDGQPIGRHFRLMIYDDVVTKDSVSSPEMIRKVTESVSLSFNLGSILGNRRWFIGTRYHMADTYAELIKRGAVKLRLYSATKDGLLESEPWLWSRELLQSKIRDMGSYVAMCQLFNNPVMEGEQTFSIEWIRYWKPERFDRMNVYMLVDPANSKTKKSDYTVMWVVGLGPDNNYYIIDGIRDKLTVKERTQRLMSLHSRYRPVAVGYEKYGIQTDIDFAEEIMAKENYRFKITPLGGNMGKEDRIRRIQPLFESGRFYIPERLVRVDYQGQQYDLTQSFLNDEYLQFPYMTHDDMLDCLSRIVEPDLKAFFPSPGKTDPFGRMVDEKEDTEYAFDTYAVS